MTIAAAIFLIAVGAILKFATNFHVHGVSIDTVGVILMIAGAAGLLLSFFQEAIWSDRARRHEVAATEQRDALAAQERRDPPRRLMPLPALLRRAQLAPATARCSWALLMLERPSMILRTTRFLLALLDVLVLACSFRAFFHTTRGHRVSFRRFPVPIPATTPT